MAGAEGESRKASLEDLVTGEVSVPGLVVILERTLVGMEMAEHLRGTHEDDELSTDDLARGVDLRHFTERNEWTIDTLDLLAPMKDGRSWGEWLAEESANIPPEERLRLVEQQPATIPAPDPDYWYRIGQ